jgi:hypothetical protein
MNKDYRGKRIQWLAAVTAALFVVAGVLAVRAVSAAPMQGQGPLAGFHELLIKGYQANSTSPFYVQGDLVGRGLWKRTAGPSLGPPVLLPPAGDFLGGASQAEYGQFVIIAEDGSTLTADVYGTRSTPAGSSIARTMNGVYTPVSGTGRFEGISGSGPVTITTYGDGSQALALVGFARLAR